MRWALLSYLSTLLLFCPVSSRLVNITIDDQLGDSTNGKHITYSPTVAWQVGQTCLNCTAKPSPASDAILGTWSDATFNPSGTVTNDVPGQIIKASVSFVGIAVYVVCILTGSPSGPDGNTDMTFFVDDVMSSFFQKSPNGDPAYLFNQTVFSQTGLTNGTHTVTLESGIAGEKALILLDAIIYTVDDGSDSSSASATATGATSVSSSNNTSSSNSATSQLNQNSSKTNGHAVTIGVIVAVVVVVLGICLGLLLFLRGRRHNQRVRVSLDGPSRGIGNFGQYVVSEVPVSFRSIVS